MKKVLLCLLLSGLTWSVVSFANSLHAAKAQGLVGEQVNGYLGIVITQPAPELVALVKDINHQRQQKYQEVASRAKQPLSVVETLAGKKAQEKTQAGQYIKTASGQWQKR